MITSRLSTKAIRKAATLAILIISPTAVYSSMVTVAPTPSLAVAANRFCTEVLVTTISRALQAMTNFTVVQGMTFCLAIRATTTCGAMVMTIFSWEVQAMIT